MPLWKIAWRSIQRRALASWLTMLSLGLGVMLVVAILLILGVVAESFRNNSSLGYNMIVGPKGGKLQLVLNTVYYLSAPVENIPYAFYKEFLPADQRGDQVDGKYAAYIEKAIPVCLGDYYGSYRVVGTTPEMFDNFVYDEVANKKYEFAEGRNFQTWSEEHGYFEAVVGAKVARSESLKVGDTLMPTHSSEEGHEHDRFHIVGILAPSGTPNDRAVFVNMEGFYLLDGHAKPIEGADEVTMAVADSASSSLDEQSPTDVEESSAQAVVDHDHGDETAVGAEVGGEQDHDALHDHDAQHRSGERRAPLPEEAREVTAILLRTNLFGSLGLANVINEGPIGQAVMPIREIEGLFRMIVDPLQMLLLLIAAMVCVVSGVGILVSIYNSMTDRRHEIAVMRSLGARRRTVMAVVLLEAVMLAVGGGLIGWAAGHGLMGLVGPLIEARTGVTVSPLELAPAVELLASETGASIIRVSPELLLVPLLMMLAVAVGLLPAIAAYRTDVAKSLSAVP